MDNSSSLLDTENDLWQMTFLAHLNRRLEQAEPEQIIRWAFQDFGENLAIGTAFGASGMVLIDLALRIDPHVDIFYIDTGYFFAETLELIRRAEEHYGRSFRRVTPAQTLPEQDEAYGSDLYHKNPDLCCHLRKVLPMSQALRGRIAWMAALRRDQSPTRANTPILRWSRRYQLVKIAPLARWTEADVWRYIHTHKVPYNKLHDQQYPSIGCWPCTQPAASGESLRSGRWPGLDKTECGLHWEKGQGI